jgi:hypothetical protein
MTHFTDINFQKITSRQIKYYKMTEYHTTGVIM